MQQGVTDINVEMYLSSIIIRREDSKCFEDTDCFVIFWGALKPREWTTREWQTVSGDQEFNAP